VKLQTFPDTCLLRWAPEFMLASRLFRALAEVVAEPLIGESQQRTGGGSGKIDHVSDRRSF